MTKEEFYNSITADTVIDEDFLKMLHAYSLYDSQFLIDVMMKFDSFGRNRVSDVFAVYMYLHNESRNVELLPAAKWLRQQIDEEYEKRRKAGEEQRKQKNCSNSSQQKNCSMQQNENSKDRLNRLKALI